MSGWLPVPRAFFQGHLWDERREYSKAEAFLYLAAEARFEPGIRWIGGKTIHLGRGELVASLRFLAEAWGWTKDRVGRFLSALESIPDPATRIRRETRQGETIIILCSYKDWGASRDDKRDSNNDTERDADATVIRQQRDETEKGKERKEEEEEAPAPPPASPIVESLRETFPDAPRDITGRQHADMVAHQPVLAEMTPDDWLALRTWLAAPLRIRGRKSAWPRDRAEFLANAGEVLETVREWWRKKGGRAWANRPDVAPSPPTSSPSAENEGETIEDPQEALAFFRAADPKAATPSAATSSNGRTIHAGHRHATETAI